jgi:hypothetical protein
VVVGSVAVAGRRGRRRGPTRTSSSERVDGEVKGERRRGRWCGGGGGEGGAGGERRSRRERSAGSRSAKEARRSVQARSAERKRRRRRAARRSCGSEAGWRRCPAARRRIRPPVRASSPSDGGGGAGLAAASAGMAVGLRWWIGDGEAREWGIWACRRSQADHRAGRVSLGLGWMCCRVSKFGRIW